MKILMTGFTSRTVGSDRNLYDYMCNVDVLRETLKLAGHDVDQRQVSLIHDPDIASDYDAAIVGVAAANGLSSRYKLGSLHVLATFGTRVGIFPSDGKNVAIFPASVQSETRHASHSCGPYPAYLLGEGMGERNNVVEAKVGRAYEEQTGAFAAVLEKLPQTRKLACEFPALFPLHSWGRPDVYARAWGARVTAWDPSLVALRMQFPDLTVGERLPCAEMNVRERAWILASLQDNGPWLKKQGCKWPVVSIGNKRAAKAGLGHDYVSEDVLIRDYYTAYFGTLAFGYPLGKGGWWRMRYWHAALAGCITLCDEQDAASMPKAFQWQRFQIERMDDEKLAETALAQYRALCESATSVDETVGTVDRFVKSLIP